MRFIVMFVTVVCVLFLAFSPNICYDSAYSNAIINPRKILILKLEFQTVKPTYCYLRDAKLRKTYIHLINQARGPYWENIGPRS